MSPNDKATPSGDLPRKSRRRWLQMSLRTLLILVTLLSVWLGVVVHRGERQRRAVAAIKQIGSVIYENDTVDALLNVNQSASYWWLRWLPRDYFDNVYNVDLSESKVTDSSMVHLKVLTRVEVLNLSGATGVTDAGLAHIQDLSRLNWLILTDTPITDAGLVHIQGLTWLDSLYLDGTQVTDAGLRQLQRLTSLQGLYLSDTQVTDAGLDQLQGLTSLRELNLSGTQVTAAGVAKLQGVLPLPNCMISR